MTSKPCADKLCAFCPPIKRIGESVATARGTIEEVYGLLCRPSTDPSHALLLVLCQHLIAPCISAAVYDLATGSGSLCLECVMVDGSLKTQGALLVAFLSSTV